MKTGQVIKSTGSWYSVKTGNNVVDCKLRGNFRIKGIKTTNPVAVGDIVDYEILDNEKTGLIKAIHERKNYIVRKATNLSKRQHILAANIDQALLFITMEQPPTTNTFIDRFLVAAEAYRIPVRLVFNKIDLYSTETTRQMNEWIAVYEAIGYECYRLSVTKKTYLETVKQLMQDKTNVLAGHSGTGKSTLINTIEPALNIKTAEISEYHKTGKHTTTFPEMYPLSIGGAIIDTPGIRAFGMIDMKKWEYSHYFREMFSLLNQCQYHNCTHTHEPGCAVKDAVVQGDIAKFRYFNYLSLLEDDTKHRQ